MSEPLLLQANFGSSADSIAAIGRWAEEARASGYQLGDLLALVAIGADGMQVVQLAPRSFLSSELDMVNDAVLLGVLATPDEPHDLRVVWSTEGRDDVRHATLSELESKLAPRARDLRAMN